MKKSLLLTSMLLLAHVSYGQITFNFHDGSELIDAGAAFDNAEGSANFETGGVTLTAEAFLGGVSAGTDLNGSNSGGFGINSPTGGDEASKIDNDLGIESMVFRFDTPGTFDTINLSVLGGTAEAVLSFDGGNSFDLFEGSATELTGGATDIHTITESFVSGQNITLAVSGLAAAGTNFGLDAFTISTTAIPEPSTYALIFGGLALGVVVWKRRRAVQA